jgi:hypothetical protein
VAIPSAKDGTIVVETTWRGSRGGHLWDIVKKALERPDEQDQPDDWRVVFFPWQDDPAYSDAEPRPLTEETLRYFSGQMSWYQRARDQYGLFVKREYPTTIEECFQEMSEFVHEGEDLDRFEIRAVHKDDRGISVARHKPSKLSWIELSPVVVPYHAIYYH